jgi:hypothetical protein
MLVRVKMTKSPGVSAVEILGAVPCRKMEHSVPVNEMTLALETVSAW